MKILDSFDTKLDEKELLDAIAHYGEGNAILTKKHRVFLLGPLFLLILAMGAFSLLVWFSYSQYFHSDPLIFWIVCSGQFAVTLAWIIHSFTTIFSTIKKHRRMVLPYASSISTKSLKDETFESYLRHSFVSLILQAVLMILDVVLAILLKVNSLSGWLIVFGGVVLNIGFIAAIWRAIEKIIDFEMYFNIFTPEQFTFYRQKGILKTESVSIATSSIKMIKEKKG
ncbi:MAG: hypothetical protein LBO09_02990 [Candidatus Peribacteria bacterium]|jgi:hypothetical protein|nr:hypothetical protein [Candidatus Peribacteria bacterium]